MRVWLFFNNSVLKMTGAFGSYAQGSHCLQRGNSFGSFSFRWFKQIYNFQCLVLKGLKEANLILLPQAQEHPEATGREECGLWGDKEKPGFYSILTRGRLSRWNKVETLKRQKLMKFFVWGFFNGFLQYATLYFHLGFFFFFLFEREIWNFFQDTYASLVSGHVHMNRSHSQSHHSNHTNIHTYVQTNPACLSAETTSTSRTKITYKKNDEATKVFWII